jgi:hypothetical protein
MRAVLDRLCGVACIEYQLKEVGIFKYDGTTRIGVFADELEDAFPEYRGNLVLGDRNAVDAEGCPRPQSLSTQVEFLYLKAIQELSARLDRMEALLEAHGIVF